ncbi:MAG: zinc-dependent alcohol dehydrogenase family protein [Verrucomicrobia bacterium]|nr:zinc-dependent alcohol dehydrogenase family protein [Verrucomicrobiota bacterium]
MRAMLLKKIGSPLFLSEEPIPTPLSGQVRIKVEACAICRTDLHILDGELPTPALPLIMGHQIVGIIDSPSKRFQKGALVGVPWLGKTCGVCPFCKQTQENLCNDPQFTGYTMNGGFAEYTCAYEEFVFPLQGDPIQIAPLLCSGMLGYRSLKMAGDAKKIGFYGFGAAAHLLIQIANYHQQQIYAFTRKGDHEGQGQAKKLGAVWAGSSEEPPPDLLDAAIIFAPVGPLVPLALKAVRKGGSVICAGIHMSDIPSFPYEILWGERILRSVANLTRQDGEEFLSLAPKIPLKTQVTTYPLEKVNEALRDLKEGKISGSAVIVI